MIGKKTEINLHEYIFCMKYNINGIFVKSNLAFPFILKFYPVIFYIISLSN